VDPVRQFDAEREERIRALGSDAEFRELSLKWLESSMRKKYVYNFEWLGRPIIQTPNDIVALQEIVFATKPDLIIETGIAHGGSLILSASLMALNAMCGGPSAFKVVGVDIEIRAHNRAAIERHPMARHIAMIEGSSTAADVVAEVKRYAAQSRSILVCLDSNHTRDHVAAELEAYASLVSPGSYCIVFDTFVDDVPADVFPDRPWGPGNNPKTAVREFLARHPEFEVDATFDKLMITAAPGGFLRRLR
jgi:cephalosporin hydroxylase